MAVTLEYTGKVTDGKLKLVHEARFKEELKTFEGKTVTLTLHKKTNKRSNAQNSYYWGVVVPLVQEGARDMGEKLTADQTHEMLKRECLKGELINKETGDIVNFARTTTVLTTVEFMDFIADIQQFATEFMGLYIPDPNEVLGEDEAAELKQD